MNLLFITPQLPYPPRQGTTIRNYNLIQYLAQEHTVDLISFTTPGDSLDVAGPLRDLCRSVDCVAQPARPTSQRIRDTFLSALPDMGHRLESPEMRALIERRANESIPGEWDIIQVEGIEVAQYGLQLIQALQKRSPCAASPLPQLVFDDHNCEYLLQKRNALNDLRIPSRWPAAIYSLLQWQKLERYERRICHAANAVLAVSDADQQALVELAPTSQVTVIVNGFDLPSVQSQADIALQHGEVGQADVNCEDVHREDINQEEINKKKNQPLKFLFIGKMDYRPNVDAMLWFGQHIFPLIRKERRDVCLQIVGASPHPRLNEIRALEGVEFTGMVEKIEPYLHNAAVYIIPLRVGGGTRFKALEAMAFAKPIVSTTLGVEGIPVEDGKELLIADTPSAFAQAALTLLADIEEHGALAESLGKNAHQLVRDQFTWPSIIPKLVALYEELLTRSEAVEDSREGLL